MVKLYIYGRLKFNAIICKSHLINAYLGFLRMAPYGDLFMTTAVMIVVELHISNKCVIKYMPGRTLHNYPTPVLRYSLSRDILSARIIHARIFYPAGYYVLVRFILPWYILSYPRMDT